MGSEVGNKNDLSVGNYVVFTDITYRLSGNIWSKKKAYPRDDEQVILDAACGALRPGRLTFILGPSGAGKTSLLKILAGRKFSIYILCTFIRRSYGEGKHRDATCTYLRRILMICVKSTNSHLASVVDYVTPNLGKRGVKGSIQGIGKNAVLVAQHATLIDALTVRETLHFAAVLKLPKATRLERYDTIEMISKQLGIRDVGLDSVSSLSVAKALQAVARTGRTVACVIHQPSSQLFSSADDVMLLANGRTLYAGSIEDLPNTLKTAGLFCPRYYNMADYLIEIASNKHTESLAVLEQEAKLYATEMRKIADNDNSAKNEKIIEISSEAEALLNVNTLNVRDYAASYGQQLRALLWRGYIGALRDVHLTQIRLVTHLLVALLLGALYKGAGAEAHRMTTNTGCLFFFLLFIFFSNAMPTIHNFPVESTVVLQEHLNKWYSLTMYCASKILVDLPIQLLCATVFIFPAWYLTSQPMELDRIALAWMICALTTILAQTFGLVMGAACGVKLGMFVIPATNIPMLMFSGFFIPYHEMPVYLRPFALISYFRYAFDAFLSTVYGFDRPNLPCHKDFCFYKNPSKYLDFLGLSKDFYNDVIVLLVWILVLEISLICVLKYRVYKACR
ncbi:ATP-binding cassette sub-family G member 4 [Papilio machaon]|uniref:ATP-binding cassette sub-family G member 4 n=1 Tax=Papilio machaon TaxID=76193 RepID=A0A194R0I9_PAPMA|nr:ATP-binding cassette sub-family G member 4 [Papilio machaon]